MYKRLTEVCVTVSIPLFDRELDELHPPIGRRVANEARTPVDPREEALRSIEVLQADAALEAVQRVEVEHALALVRVTVERIQEPL